MIAGAVLLAAILAAPSAAPATCALHAQGSLWMGSCGPLVEDAATTVSIARSASITSGAWQRDLKPQTSWSGTMVAGDDPATPVELEIYADRRGLLRSVYGWFPVSGFVRANATLRFRVDRAREAAPSSTDREIILLQKESWQTPLPGTAPTIASARRQRSAGASIARWRKQRSTSPARFITATPRFRSCASS